MSRAIPLFGLHTCNDWCWPCARDARHVLTRKERRWIRRAAALELRRQRRRDLRQRGAYERKLRRLGVDVCG